MWSFLFHRVTGLVLAAWVLLFTIEQSTLLAGPDTYDRFRGMLTAGPFRLFEIAVVASAVFHALNGLRIVLTDFVPSSTAHTDRLLRAQTAAFFALAVPAAWIILVRFIEGG